MSLSSPSGGLKAYPAGFARNQRAELAPDGTFRVGGLRPNPLIVNAQPLLPEWALSSWLVNGREFIDEPFELTDPVTTVDAFYSNLWAELRVNLDLPPGVPITDVRVMVLPGDARQRFGAGGLGRRFREILPIRLEMIRMPGLPPGEYRAVAMVDPALREIDAAYLDTLLDASTPVVLWPRTPREVKLTVQRR